MLSGKDQSVTNQNGQPVANDWRWPWCALTQKRMEVRFI